MRLATGILFARIPLDNGWLFAYLRAMKSGRRLLRDWIDRILTTDREAARRIGVHYTHLSQILNGRRSPGLANAVEIERATGIPVEAWLPTGEPQPDQPPVPVARNRPTGKA